MTDAHTAAVLATASQFHDEWRAPRALPGGGYEPRPKTTRDADWIAVHGTDQVDIANLAFSELPCDWQADNLRAATQAVSLVLMAGGAVHDSWASANGAWAPDEQKLAFPLLSAAEQEKDLAAIELAARNLRAALNAA